MQQRFTRLVGLALVLGLCTACGGADDTATREPDGTDVARVSAVETYGQFAAEVDDPGDPATVAGGLRTLAAALSEAGLGGPDLNVDLRVTAEHVLLNPASAATADAVRTVLLSVAGAFEGMDGETLRAAAESVDPDRPLDEQAAAVGHVFRELAGALERQTGSR